MLLAPPAPIDGPFLLKAFARDGFFWWSTLLLLTAMAYSLSHFFRERTLLSKPICFVAGHNWRIGIRDAGQWAERQHLLGPLAGSDARCLRCGAETTDRRMRAAPTRAPEPRQSIEEHQSHPNPKKKRAKPKAKGLPRYERDIFLENVTSVEAAYPSEAKEPSTPSGTSTSPPPSKPEGLD